MALTIRTTEQHDLLIAKLCNQLDIKTASKLFIHLIENYEYTQRSLHNGERLNRDLSNSLQERNEVIKEFQSSFSNLMSIKS